MSSRHLAWSAGALVAALLLAALGWGLLHPGNPDTTEAVGKPAPNLTIQALGGGSVSLTQFRGRAVVLNFWASWCVSCQEEDPVLSRASRALGSGVAFVGVDIQDHPAAAKAYRDRMEIPYPVGPAAGGVPAAYGVSAPPETFFIAPDGLVVARVIGPLSAQSLTRNLALTGVAA